RFRTTCDTEVLLLGYVEWGPACVDRFNGIFAFAIWSTEEEQLFMARDRLGVKPLFYRLEEGRLLFGSEPKAILAHT
ncbi:asparagine synthetase B, partial [Acinetobacter baumannii]